MQVAEDPPHDQRTGEGGESHHPTRTPAASRPEAGSARVSSLSAIRSRNQGGETALDASVNASTGARIGAVSVSLSREDMEKALRLWRDVVTHPGFDAGRLVRAKAKELGGPSGDLARLTKQYLTGSDRVILVLGNPEQFGGSLESLGLGPVR